MGEVRVRNLDDEVVRELRGRARRKGVDLAAAAYGVCLRMRRFALGAELSAKAKELRESIRETSGELDDSTPLIHA